MPARRYICSPQGGGPLTLSGTTLSAAFYGQPYVQYIGDRAKAGKPPYTFNLQSNVGPDTPAVAVNGFITMTPAVPSVWVTETGAYVVTETGAVVVTQ